MCSCPMSRTPALRRRRPERANPGAAPPHRPVGLLAHLCLVDAAAGQRGAGLATEFPTPGGRAPRPAGRSAAGRSGDAVARRAQRRGADPAPDGAQVTGGARHAACPGGRAARFLGGLRPDALRPTHERRAGAAPGPRHGGGAQRQRQPGPVGAFLYRARRLLAARAQRTDRAGAHAARWLAVAAAGCDAVGLGGGRRTDQSAADRALGGRQPAARG